MCIISRSAWSGGDHALRVERLYVRLLKDVNQLKAGQSFEVTRDESGVRILVRKNDGWSIQSLNADEFEYIHANNYWATKNKRNGKRSPSKEVQENES